MECDQAMPDNASPQSHSLLPEPVTRGLVWNLESGIWNQYIRSRGFMNGAGWRISGEPPERRPRGAPNQFCTRQVHWVKSNLLRLLRLL